MIYKVDLALFSAILQETFKLKFKPVMRTKTSVKFQGDACFGVYSGEGFTNGKFKHTITIARDAVKTREALFATMAHEFAHAWQMENMLELTHAKAEKFDYWKNYFSYWFNVDIVLMV